MYRKKQHLRVAALCCLLTFLQSIFLPVVVYALTAGPSAPQSSSFEPVDTSDMVNLLTGDFVYNLPLAEVPSPEGGFPINLFYHAGIKTHQEASNYGLGWGFNPGSISRSVNGFPDDYDGEDHYTNVYSIFEDKYDSGTTNTTYTFGFTIPKTPFSLTFSETHNSQLGNYGSNALNVMGVNVLDYTSQPGGRSLRVGSGLQPSYGGGIVDHGNDLLGWERSGRQGIAPGYSSVSFSLRDGLKTTRVGKAGDWNIEITSKGLDLGIINFGKTTVRQWLDLSRPLRPYGSLGYALNRHGGQSPSSLYTNTMDLIEDRNNVREQENSGGVHFAYDNYQVNSAQVGGTLRPIIFQNGSLMGREFLAGNFDPNDRYYNLQVFDGYDGFDGNASERVRFRYNGEFASKHLMASGTIYQNSSTPTFAASNSSFTAAPTDDPANGFKDRYLKGAKHVEYFGEFDMGFWGSGTQQTVSKTKKVKNFTYNRPSNYVGGANLDNSKVHAFKVTGEDGSEHHFGLPVFITYEESVAFETERWQSGVAVEQNTPANAYSRLRKSSPFPYTWLQTAILGNDYVDRNDDGLTDPGDYGRYVRFAYGNHTQNKPYPYRAPYEGYEFEPSFSSKTATFGKKQLFYLNSIQTRTHTAIFYHSARADGRGATKDGLNANISQSSHTMTQLKTDKVVILRNEDVQSLISSGHLVDRGIDWAQVPDSDHDPYLTSEFNATVQSKALKVLDFYYSYDLCQQTTNSTASGSGKLTLTSISKKGVGGSLVLPRYVFGYDKDNAAANPDFNKHAFDRWGFYKGDVQLIGPSGYQYPANRRVSCGNHDATAWSLRSIEMPIGSKVEEDYEADTYYRVGSEDYNFPYSEDYLLFRKTRGFFTSNSASFQINIPNTAQGNHLRQELQTIQANDTNLSLIFRNPSNGEEICNEWFEVQSIVFIGGSWRVTFSSSIWTSIPHPLYISALSLMSSRSPHETICANSPAVNEVHGGGVRVGGIQYVNSSGEIERQQSYRYHSPDGAYSSGAVAYEPSEMNLYKGYLMFSDNPTTNTFSSLGAQVNYSQVDVTTKSGGGDFFDQQRYTFETYDQPTHLDIVHEQSSYGGFDRIHTTRIHDKTGQIGRPLAIEHLNELGHCYRKKIFEYYTSSAVDQGTTRENVHSIRSRKRYFGTPSCHLDGYINFNGHLAMAEEAWKVLITQRNTYVSALKEVRNIEHGLESSTEYSTFDFFTGKVRRIEEVSFDNQKKITQVDLAYQAYPEMGSKVDDPNNKHMLTQEAGQYVYRHSVNNSNLLSATAQTWSENAFLYRERSGNTYVEVNPANSENIWRPYTTYNWEGPVDPDGTFDASQYTPFNHSLPPNHWTNTLQVTRYDRYSRSLEEIEPGNYISSTKMGYDQSLALITARNAKYLEMAFSSAEDFDPDGTWFGGEVRAPSASNVVTTQAHTGTYSVRLNGSNRYGFNYKAKVAPYIIFDLPPVTEIDRKKYEARVWIHESNTRTDFDYLYCSYENDAGTILHWEGVRLSDPGVVKAGEWYQLRLPVDLTRSILSNVTKIGIGTWVASNSGDVYFDDFRFAPLDAEVECFVYDQHTDQVTHILDQEHFYTKYEYDDSGRLTKVIRETADNPTGKQLVSEHDFHFKRPIN